MLENNFNYIKIRIAGTVISRGSTGYRYNNDTDILSKNEINIDIIPIFRL